MLVASFVVAVSADQTHPVPRFFRTLCSVGANTTNAEAHAFIASLTTACSDINQGPDQVELFCLDSEIRRRDGEIFAHAFCAAGWQGDQDVQLTDTLTTTVATLAFELFEETDTGPSRDWDRYFQALEANAASQAAPNVKRWNEVLDIWNAQFKSTLRGVDLVLAQTRLEKLRGLVVGGLVAEEGTESEV